MMKFYILAEHKYTTKILFLSVAQCTSSPLTSQYIVFTLYMIGFISVNFKDKASGWVFKIYKDYAEHLTFWGNQVHFWSCDGI